MKIKTTNKKYFIIGIIIILLVIALLILKSPENNWIKHKNPGKNPDEVKTQQEAIICALQLYQQAKQDNLNFSSQCLGSCGDYSIDIVNIPRTEEDNKKENQCQDYIEGKTTHFIELDKAGNIFRIV